MLSDYLLTHMADAKSVKLPRHRQLYEALRKAILQGKLPAGERLPSSRDLAQDLQLSRNTVMASFAQLLAEGYLTSSVGSGTYVSDSLQKPRANNARPGQAMPAKLSQRGLQITQQFLAQNLEIQPFTPGLADFSVFPLALWQRLQNKHWKMVYAEMLDYSSGGGFAPLRRALAQHLRISRGVEVQAERILITSGTQQSLALCASVLADAGDTIWMEDPAYWGATKVMQAAQLHIQAVATDVLGMNPHTKQKLKPPRLIYLTPSHQYPTGAVMGLERRPTLLDCAQQHQAWILEDDYDSEYRFSGAPLSSLQGMDTQQRVIYMGTFSKTLYPGLKLGYLVAPPALAQALQMAHHDLNRPGQIPLQAALAEFIELGHFATTLRRARISYGARRQSLLKALQPCLELGLPISGADQGLHLCLHLPSHIDDTQIAIALARKRLIVRPLSAYCLERKDLRGLVIGYGYTQPQDIEKYGPVLAKTILEHLKA